MSADADLARLAELASCGSRTKSGAVTLPTDLLAPQAPLTIVSGVPPWTRAIWLGVDRSSTFGMVTFRLTGNKGQVAYRRTFQLGSGGDVAIDAGGMCGTTIEVISHFQAAGENQLPAVTWVCSDVPPVSADYCRAFLQQSGIVANTRTVVPDGADLVQLTENLTGFSWELQTNTGGFTSVTDQTSAGDVLERKGDLFRTAAGSPTTALIWRVQL